MIALDLSPAPREIELLPGVRVRVRPMSAAIWLAARTAAAVPERSEGAADAETVAEWTVATIRAVAERAILSWEGVGDSEGRPIPPSPAAIAALLDIGAAWTAFNRLYLDPWWILQAEKNGSAPSPAGTSAGARPIAATAEPAAPPVLTSSTAP